MGDASLAPSVAILGCARNCAPYLSRSLDNVMRVAALFKDHRIFLFENDSSDGTAAILHAFTSLDPNRRRCTTRRFLTAKAPGRTRRLAYIRQCLQDQLIQSGYRPSVVVVMDLDDIGASPSPERVENFITQACAFRGWDAAFPMISYDLAAWRPWRPAPLHEIVARAHGRPTRVVSSFNGIGVYKGSVYRRGTYRAPGQRLFGRHSRAGPCEHVTFHTSIAPYARLAMLTSCPYP